MTTPEGILELFATVLVLAGVWLIGNLDIRGQYVMLLAQILWGMFAYVRGMRWMFVQSIILAGLTVNALIVWHNMMPKG